MMKKTRTQVIVELLSRDCEKWYEDKNKVITFLVEFTNHPGYIVDEDTKLFNKLSPKFKDVLNITNNTKYNNHIYDSLDSFICVPYKEFDYEFYTFMMYRITELLFNNTQNQHLYLMITDNHGSIYYLSNMYGVYESIKSTHMDNDHIVLDFFTL